MVNDIYLLQLGSQPLALVGRLVQKQERDSYIQREKQYTKQYKNNTETQNRENRQKIQIKNKHKKNIKRQKSSNLRITQRSK